MKNSDLVNGAAFLYEAAVFCGRSPSEITVTMPRDMLEFIFNLAFPSWRGFQGGDSFTIYGITFREKPQAQPPETPYRSLSHWGLYERV